MSPGIEQRKFDYILNIYRFALLLSIWSLLDFVLLRHLSLTISHSSASSKQQLTMEKKNVNRNRKPTSSDGPVVPLAAKLQSATGKMTDLTTNYWMLKTANVTVYQYDITITCFGWRKEEMISFIVNKQNNNNDMNAVYEKHRNGRNILFFFLQLLNMKSLDGFAYDGQAILYSNVDIADKIKELSKSSSTTLRLDSNKWAPEFSSYFRLEKLEGAYLEVTFNMANQLNIGNFKHMINRSGIFDFQMKQFFEILTSEHAIRHKKFASNGKDFLYSDDEEPQDRKFAHEFILGAEKSINFVEFAPGQVAPAIVVDSKIGDFYKSCSLKDSILEILQIGRNANLNNLFNEPSNRKKVGDFLRGLRLDRRDGSGSSIFSPRLSEEPVRSLKFECDGKIIPLLKYKKYAEKPNDFNQNWPALEYNNRGRKEWFPIEYLVVAPRQAVPQRKHIKHKDNQQVAPFTPVTRFEKIQKLLKDLGLNDGGNKILKTFGVTVSMEPLKVKGISKTSPTITSGKGIEMINKSTWQISKFKRAATVREIVFVGNEEERNQRNALQWSQFESQVRLASDKIVDTLGLMGMTIPKTSIEFLPKQEELLVELEKVIKKLSMEKNGRSDCIEFLFDRLQNPSHADLKMLEKKTACVTQEVTMEVAAKLGTKTAENICYKANIKLGGKNYEVTPDQHGMKHWITNQETLIIGYDVLHCHKPYGESAVYPFPNVVGFCCNGASDPESFIGDYSYQSAKKEEVDGEVLKWRVSIMLKNLKAAGRKIPKTIIILRDGVSTGQYQMVLSRELPAIREACMQFGKENKLENYSPRITLIIVTKRHNTRLFDLKDNKLDVCPLTAVDTGIIRPGVTEFFMITAKNMKGTANPPLYNLLLDENNMTMEGLQSIIVALAHEHQICGSAIGIPEPVYRADEYATRGNEIFQAASRNNILNNLWHTALATQEFKLLSEDELEKIIKQFYAGATKMLGYAESKFAYRNIAA